MRFFSTSWSNDATLSYKHFVVDAGFRVTRIGPETSNGLWREILAKEHSSAEFANEQMVYSMEIVYREVIDVLTKYNPTIVLHGFMDGLPMKIMEVPTVAYVSLPFIEDFVFVLLAHCCHCGSIM
jgi:hypothetical protein